MNREPIPEPVVPGFEPGTTTMASKRVATELTGPVTSRHASDTFWSYVYTSGPEREVTEEAAVTTSLGKFNVSPTTCVERDKLKLDVVPSTLRTFSTIF